jgi:phosphoglycerate dehydrogenase-like enzyme
MRIGIIGLGFVGSAVKNAYDNAKIQTVCQDPAKG